MADDVRWLTYAEIAETLGIGPDSARNLVRRRRWPRQTGNDGLARIGVPVEQLAERKADSDGAADSPANGTTDPPTDSPTDGLTDAPADRALIALGVLRDHIVRLESEIVSLKVERDLERARALQVDALNAVLELERKRVEEARQRADELRQERDRWSVAAEAFQTQIVEMNRRPKGLLSWLRRA